VEVWFNHAHLFHPSDLPLKTQIALKSICSSVDDYPKYCCFSSGEEIPLEFLNEIRRAQRECTLQWDWVKGDVMILDNYLLSHGRSKFNQEDKRRILASLLF
jgi:hypothetical protein